MIRTSVQLRRSRRLHRFLSTSAVEPTGFIGLGNMGRHMARNLSNQFPLLVYDVNESNATQAAHDNPSIARASNLQELAQSCPVIVTMLPGCRAVHQVMNTLTATPLCKTALVLDCSTVSPTTSRHWQRIWNDQHNAAFLDAPVSGGVQGATQAALTFMVGSPSQTALEHAAPYFDAMGLRVVECGGPGAGAVAKLCNNLALATQMIGIAEAMNLGQALGMDPAVLASVMNTSTAKCWSCETNNPHPHVGTTSANQYQGGFAVDLMCKDLGLAVDAGQDANVALPLGTTAKELYKLAALRGLGNKDFGVILSFLKGE